MLVVFAATCATQRSSARLPRLSSMAGQMSNAFRVILPRFRGHPQRRESLSDDVVRVKVYWLRFAESELPLAAARVRCAERSFGARASGV